MRKLFRCDFHSCRIGNIAADCLLVLTRPSLPVTLAETAGTITVPDSVVAGSVIEVTWSGPGNRQDFIEVVPMDATPETAPLAATRVSQGSPLSVHAPAIPGIYQVRYMMRDTKEVLTSRQVEVKPNP